MELAFDKLPTTVGLPGGYRIKIKMVPAEDLDPDDDADWNVLRQIIRIDEAAPIEEQFLDVAHELGHAYVDWAWEVLGTYLVRRRIARAPAAPPPPERKEEPLCPLSET